MVLSSIWKSICCQFPLFNCSLDQFEATPSPTHFFQLNSWLMLSKLWGFWSNREVTIWTHTYTGFWLIPNLLCYKAIGDSCNIQLVPKSLPTITLPPKTQTKNGHALSDWGDSILWGTIINEIFVPKKQLFPLCSFFWGSCCLGHFSYSLQPNSTGLFLEEPWEGTLALEQHKPAFN